MKLTASDSVRFLISLMRMLNNPADKVSTAHACIFLNASGFPGFENKVEVLSRIADMGSVFFWKHFPDLPIQKAQLLPLFELCEHLCRAFGLYPQYDVYLQYFIDNVLNYTAKEQSGIEGFLQWWDDNESKLSLDIPETSDAVQIVTIHKSKGLSFRVVICPYVWESKGRKDNFRWYDTKECIPFLPTVYLNPVKNLEKSPIGEQIIAENRKILLDNLNILYVAFTRAEERLMIFTKHLAKDDEHLQNIVNNALMAAFEWDSAEGFFRLGEDVEVSVKEEKEEATEITSCNSYEWTDRLRISGRGEDDLHAHAREFGVVIHETLAKIGRYCTPQKAIQIACLRYPTMANLIRITLENLFDDPRILPFFEATANSYSEFEIITSEKKILRPDKLIIYEHYADVIDFKTGRPSESHHEQLLAYSSHLQKILKKPVNKYLLYVNPEEHLLEKIP
jgi:ATP-dependent exoDNAse (exonuclease V) beta subunit